MLEQYTKVYAYYNCISSMSKFKVCCFFHQDPKPSLQINLLTGSFYCYGCGKTGDIYKFIQLIEKCNRFASIKIYNKIVNTKDNINYNYVKEIKIVNDVDARLEAKRYFYSLNKTNWGYISNHYMLNRGIKKKVLLDYDVRINNSSNYPIIIPIIDNTRFKGYVCRTDKKDIEQDRKYLYNKGFKKNKCVVGKYTKDFVIVTEGILDQMRMISLLDSKIITEVVSIFGWCISSEQVKKLKRKGIKYIINGLDNDVSGRQGYKYLKKYFNVIDMKLPDYIKDLGDLNLIDCNYIIYSLEEKIKELMR